LGDYSVLPLLEPFTPERYIEALTACQKAGFEVVIIDSISHEWQGKGGCLQIHEQLGGRFQDWAKVTPRHQAFIDAILTSPCHVITTVRRKIDYSMDIGPNGRTQVVKHGTKEITREGFEYELTLNFELVNEHHLAKTSKDRTGLFMGKPEFIINQATGRKLLQWCMQGTSLEEAAQEISACRDTEALKQVYYKYPSLQKEMQPLILEKKAALETEQQIALLSKHRSNGSINPNQ
jgi:hypothetical protein